MAATRKTPSHRSCGSVLVAALASLGATGAQAESAPEAAVLAYKQLHYQDGQSGLQRISADSPSLYLLLPLGEQWSVDASAVLDSVSGASPRYYSAISGASEMHDLRRAYDAHLSYYRPRSAYSLSFATSDEHDYLSNAVSADARFSTEDNNTTVNIGFGASADRINPVNGIVSDAHKDSYQAIAGITQALTPSDLLQLQLGYTRGQGYYSDPYKLADNRPDERGQQTAVARWNHHLRGPRASLRMSYRYYHDTWQVNAHTLSVEWAQRLGEAVTLTPVLSYYSQSAASFYVDPAPDGSVPAIPPGIHSSLDQRLSAFGALSGGAKIEWRINGTWTTDLKGEYYYQRSEWRLGGNGSPGLDPFYYYAIQVGLSYRF